MLLCAELKEAFLKMLEAEDVLASERLYATLSLEQKALFIAFYDQVSLEVG